MQNWPQQAMELLPGKNLETGEKIILGKDGNKEIFVLTLPLAKEFVRTLQGLIEFLEDVD